MIQRILSGLLLAALLGRGAGAAADAYEASVQRAPIVPGARPLLTVLLDTSAAMARSVSVRPAYDPAIDYGARLLATERCADDAVYWRRGPGPAPDCSSDARVARGTPTVERGLHCLRAAQALAQRGLFVADRLAQWDHGSHYWRAPAPGDDGALECRADRGTHGAVEGAWYAADGGTSPWSGTSASEPRWNAPPLGDAYVLYDANYLEYLAVTAPTERHTLMEVAREWLLALPDVADGLDVALVRLSFDGGEQDLAGEGGMVLVPATPVEQLAAALAGALDAVVPAGPAPIGEALVETLAYLAGAPVRYGLSSHRAPDELEPSVDASRSADDTSRYSSPITAACRPLSIAALTATEPSADAGAVDAAGSLPGFDVTAGCGGNCVGSVAAWTAHGDLRADLAGRQQARLWIATDAAGYARAVAATASAGTRPVDLGSPEALVELVAAALQHDAGVATRHAVSAAGLVPVQGGHTDDVLLGQSAPAMRERWRGNLRKFRLGPAAGATTMPGIVGQDGAEVIEPGTGSLLGDAWDLWSPRRGTSPHEGGAAARLPSPTARHLYTDVNGPELTSDANRIRPGLSVTRAQLGLSANDTLTIEQLLGWLTGADSLDDDGDGDTTEPRSDLGDPGIEAPRVLAYGDENDRVTVFAATQDGVLHAFDLESGTELWGFVPSPLLARTAGLARNHETASRSHGIDGPLALHRHDANRDGRIERSDGDHAWLLFGLGRGGARYYGLDVTDPGEPRELWSLASDALPGLSLATARPVVVRLAVGGTAQSAGRWVALIAGGRDPAGAAGSAAPRRSGNRLFIVDAETGTLLWSAGGQGPGAPDLALDAMTWDLPAAPRALDLDGDGHVDRLYAIDAGGQVWRLDLVSGSTPESLGHASRVARLGASLLPTDPVDARRFRVEPDVALDRDASGRRYLAISFGSGWLERPRDTTIADRLYSLRDYAVEPMSRAEPAALTPLEEDDLVDATAGDVTLPRDARGWLVRLAVGDGEKAIGTATTVGHAVTYRTYRPLPPRADEPCGPPRGRSRVLSFDLRTASPRSLVEDEATAADERASDGLPASMRVAFPVVPGCTQRSCRRGLVGVIGAETYPLEYSNDPVRTTWRDLDLR